MLAMIFLGGCAEGNTPPALDAGPNTGRTDVIGPPIDTFGDSQPVCGPSSCEVGESRCAGSNAVVRCESTPSGCGSFTQPVQCPAQQTCINGRCIDESQCTDMDGDGYGTDCAMGDDCDDSDKSVNPGAQEVCGDNIDNNCADGVDEGCQPSCSNEPCSPGKTECTGGGMVKLCETDSNGCGTWGSGMPCPSGSCENGSCSTCVDADGDGYGMNCPAGPDCDDGDKSVNKGAREICDMKDNDCDNMTDEDFAGLGSPCEAGQGACKVSGTTVCASNGNGTTCDAQPGQPEVEKCGDNTDNDCDGMTDEGFDIVGKSCTKGSGSCQTSGQYKCDPNDPTATICDAPDPSSSGTEICDGKDNDCDGMTDEGGVCSMCVEDSYEENDTSTNATNLKSPKTINNLMSCGPCGGNRNWDWDWFFLGYHSPGTSMTIELKHPTGNNPAGNQYANLAFEFYCDSKICDAKRTTAGTKSLTIDGNCRSGTCTSNSRWTVHVYPTCSSNPQGNPTTGTPYTLIRR